MTRVERRARVSAIRADARLGAALPDPLLSAIGPDPAKGPRHTDEELFAGRPRTFITLSWAVRQAYVLGVLAIAAAPAGFVVSAMLDADPATRTAAGVVLIVLLATCAVATVGLVVGMRRAEQILADGGPGGSPRSRGTVMSLWIIPLGIAVLLVVIFVVGKADIAGAAAVVSATGLDRAAAISAVWALPWLVAWTVLMRRAAAAELETDGDAAS